MRARRRRVLRARMFLPVFAMATSATPKALSSLPTMGELRVAPKFWERWKRLSMPPRSRSPNGTT